MSSVTVPRKSPLRTTGLVLLLVLVAAGLLAGAHWIWHRLQIGLDQRQAPSLILPTQPLYEGPYYLEKTIQGALGTRAPVVFLQGASGDVTQVDNLSPYVRPGAQEWAQFVGGRVGAEAVKVLLTMAKGTEAPLDVRQRVWKIKRRAPAPERVARCREIVAAGRSKNDATDIMQLVRSETMPSLWMDGATLGKAVTPLVLADSHVYVGVAGKGLVQLGAAP